MTTILVPIRYPLKAANTRTLQRAIELAGEIGPAHLYVLHVNLIHRGEHVSRADLARAVQAEVGSLENASYHVRDAFLLEEAILYEVVQQNVDYVVVGKSLRSKWRRLLTAHLDTTVDLERFLRTHLEAELIVA